MHFMTLDAKVAQLLIDKKKTISVAESCSGGLLSHRLTNIPGSSKFFKLAIIAYSYEAKTYWLKVPKAVLLKHGAVSYAVAAFMAKGIRRLQKTDFGIGITGIAGPGGATKKKPIGLTYIAVSTPKEILCVKCLFKGNRIQIKQQTAMQALKLLLEFLKND